MSGSVKASTVDLTFFFLMCRYLQGRSIQVVPSSSYKNIARLLFCSKKKILSDIYERQKFVEWGQFHLLNNHVELVWVQLELVAMILVVVFDEIGRF